ncbi:hypothetical protein MMC16_001819 [Acarospora aff. strigata]|nr:hypothetical protein [Acarospora aff. strigata]
MGDKPLEGGCFCGNVRIQYTGEPVMKALCHCLDCRKISGSTYSTNVGVPSSAFSLVSGTPKTISKTADSGSSITSHFCPDCGTTLFRTGESFNDVTIVKVGIMDDLHAFETSKPDVELFAPHRVEWVPAIEGAKQMGTMK